MTGLICNHPMCCFQSSYLHITSQQGRWRWLRLCPWKPGGLFGRPLWICSRCCSQIWRSGQRGRDKDIISICVAVYDGAVVLLKLELTAKQHFHIVWTRPLNRTLYLSGQNHSLPVNTCLMHCIKGHLPHYGSSWMSLQSNANQCAEASWGPAGTHTHHSSLPSCVHWDVVCWRWVVTESGCWF